MHFVVTRFLCSKSHIARVLKFSQRALSLTPDPKPNHSPNPNRSANPDCNPNTRTLTLTPTESTYAGAASLPFNGITYIVESFLQLLWDIILIHFQVAHIITSVG